MLTGKNTVYMILWAERCYLNMKKHLYITGIILTAAMILNTVFASADTSSAAVFKPSRAAVTLVSDLDLVNTENMNGIVTYADLAKTLSVLTGGESAQKLYFKQYALSEEASCIEAVAVLLDIMGYIPYVELNGVTADNCMLTASKIKLLNGLKVNRNDNLTIGQLCQLVYNALNCRVMKLTGMDAGGGVYSLGKEYTLLSEYLDIEKISGVVTQSHFSSIYTANRCANKKITIGKDDYSCTLPCSEEYMGMYVDAYVKGGSNVVSVFAEESYNKIVRVAAADISDSTTAKKIVYFDEKNRRKEINVTDSTDVIYNGSLYQSYTASELKPKVGEIIAVDNNSDGKYDVIRVESYECVVAAGVSETSRTLTPRSAEYTIDISDILNGDGIISDSDGNAVSPDTIGANSVVSYAMNKSGSVYKIVVSNKKVSGYVKSFKNNSKINIGGEEYYATPMFWNEPLTFSNGDLVTAYLNHLGDVVRIDREGGSLKYGYLINFKEDSFGVKLKMFEVTGIVSVLNVKDEVNVNGTRMPAEEAFDSARRNSEFWNEAGIVPQLVKYKVNSKNEVTLIRTSKMPSEKISDEDLILNVSGNRKWFGNAQAIDPMIRLDKDAPVFSIPYDTTHDWEYKIQGYANIYMTTNSLYTCKVYDVDEDCYAGALVIQRGSKSPTIDRAYPLYLVTDVCSTVNDRGEDAIMFNYIDSDGKEDYIISQDSDISSYSMFTVPVNEIRPGAVIQPHRNEEKSEMDGYYSYVNSSVDENVMMFEYCYSNWGYTVSKTAFYSDNKLFAFGEIRRTVKDGLIINCTPKKDSDGNVIKDSDGNFEFDEEYNRLVNIPSTGVRVTRFDTSKEEAYVGSIADIGVGDRVFMDFSKGVIKWIIVYK